MTKARCNEKAFAKNTAQHAQRTARAAHGALSALSTLSTLSTSSTRSTFFASNCELRGGQDLKNSLGAFGISIMADMPSATHPKRTHMCAQHHAFDAKC